MHDLKTGHRPLGVSCITSSK